MTFTPAFEALWQRWTDECFTYDSDYVPTRGIEAKAYREGKATRISDDVMTDAIMAEQKRGMELSDKDESLHIAAKCEGRLMQVMDVAVHRNKAAKLKGELKKAKVSKAQVPHV